MTENVKMQASPLVKKKRLRFNLPRILLHVLFIIAVLACVLPFVLVIAISFTSETSVIKDGFQFIPKVFSAEAYASILGSEQSLFQLLRAYGVTILFSFVGTAISMVIMAMLGYTLSREGFFFKKLLTTMLVITMFFNGGLVPTYLVNTQLLHLNDSLGIYLTYGLVQAYTVFVFRTFFKQIPASLLESATLEGASEFQVMTRVVIPLSGPVLATFSFMGLISRWNDFTVSLYYITDQKLYTLQFLLQNILKESEFLKQLQAQMPGIVDMSTMPSETLKFAMCVLAAGPMLLVFPFFQKYFSKGMVVGAVKG